MLRKINELYEQNIVDYKVEGKNKVFFLKKTLEAKQFACITELNKLFYLLEKYPKLRLIIDRIKKHPEIKLAILFGSYAKDLAKKHSDIDIYIETRDKKIKQEVEAINSKINVKIGIYDKKNLLIKEVEKDHIIIKGVEEYFEKNEFFD
ncbi:nucleotidyltransferase domain-containing protein [Candidatus Woesearchaeota archaeon]|nr:nucleotidyltransferase domain-containing protein [Candidatus Woesearchaeota archaeon]